MDVFQAYNSQTLLKRISNGSALDLSQLLDSGKYDLKGSLGDSGIAYIKKMSGESRISFIPMQFYVDYVMLNKAMVEKAGLTIPDAWSWAEYKDFMKKVADANQAVGVAVPWDWSAQMVAEFGRYNCDVNYWINSDGTLAMADQPAVKGALQLMSDMMQDKSMISYADVITKKLDFRSEYLNGKAAAIMPGADWILRDVKDTAKYPHDFITTFAPVPTMESGGQLYYRESLNDFTSISSNSGDKEAALKFLMWYLDNGVTHMIPFGRMPSSQKINPDDVVKGMLGENAEKLFDTERYNKVIDSARKNGKFIVDDANPKYPAVHKVMQEEFEKALIKSKTVEQALADLKIRGDAELKK